jgi:hypothetical protein
MSKPVFNIFTCPNCEKPFQDIHVYYKRGDILLCSEPCRKDMVKKNWEVKG